jgi:hypothetical protein
VLTSGLIVVIEQLATSDHLPGVSHPDTIADLLAEIARSS